MDVAAGDILESDGIRRGQRSVASQRADELTDEECMTRLSGPEVEAALSALYDRYARTVYGVGLKILGNRSLAEELVQDVFLKVWRSAGTFDSSRGASPPGFTGSRVAPRSISTASAPAGSARSRMGPHTSLLPGILLPVHRRW